MTESIEVPTSEIPASSEPPQNLRELLNELVSGSTGAILLMVLVAVCYALATRFNYIWDDDAYVTGNTLLRSFAGLSRIWTEPGATPQYYPMTFTSFWLEFQTVGLNPKVSHVINIILHAGCTVLLWQILKKLAVPGAWVAAAVFAVHPIQVESVAWISERKNTLSLFFGLVSVWIYLRYIGLISVPIPLESDAAGRKGIRITLPQERSRVYALFMITFALALFSKTTVAVFPVVLAVIVWWKRGRVDVAILKTLIAPFVMGIVASSVTSYIEHHPQYVGATGPEWDVGPISRLILIGQTTCWYAWKMVWPSPLIFSYPKWALDPASPLQWLPLVLVIGTEAGLWALRKRLGRGPFAGIAIYCLGILPASGLVMVFPMRYSWVADHFAYIGSIGLIVTLVAGMTLLIGRYLAAAAALTAATVAAFVAMTIIHSYTFVDPKALWEKTLQKNPRSWMAAVNYGSWLNQRAMPEYKRWMLLDNEEEAVKQRNRNWEAAEQWTDIGLKRNPNSFEALCTLGMIHFAKREYDDALRDFNASDKLAVERGAESYLQPKFALASVFSITGKVQEALSLQKSLQELEPRFAFRAPRPFALMHTQMANRLMKELKCPVSRQMPDEGNEIVHQAIDHYVRATEILPDFVPPKLMLARIMLDLDETREALRLVNEILQDDKGNVDAKFVNANAAVKIGSYDAALAQMINILQIAPGYLPAHTRLAEIYFLTGRRDEAIAELETTLKHVPNYQPAEVLLQSYRANTTQPSTQPLFAPIDTPLQ